MKVAGYFDLDPTRMLDLVMDVFSTHVMTHYSFFIQLIRQFIGSRVRLLSGSNPVEVMQTDRQHQYAGMAFEDILKAAEGDVFVMPPSTELKNPLAQLMGFKFAHYAVRQFIVRVAYQILRNPKSRLDKICRKTWCSWLRC
jgi:THO complex subunit 2